jgi:uncharacterized protein
MLDRGPMSDRTEASGSPAQKPSFAIPALVWALLHVPVTLGLYVDSLTSALRATPPSFRAAVAPTFLVQASLLALVVWTIGLPLVRWPRVYRFTAPALAGLVTFGFAIDGRALASAGFHLNGFILRVLVQPGALQEIGLGRGDVVAVALAVLAWLAAEIAVGAWFLRRFASTRRVWIAALALLLAGVGERVYGAVLTEFGGPAIFAASGVLPAQVPVRMHGIVSRLRGGTSTPTVRIADTTRLREGVAVEDVRFARRPDVVFVLAESLPAAHLDAQTMPRLWARAEGGGGRFTRHYAGASSTNYALFSLFYAQHALKLEATVGAGRKPLLFPALRENGYDLRLLAASCVTWMDLQDTVFAGATDALQTWCTGPAGERDAPMLETARGWADAAAPDRPLFLMLFFNNTHFPYFYDPEDRVFDPDWDGKGGLAATTTPGPLVAARARNAAHALDRRLDAFLAWFEARRGRAPLVLFTGDHGEEFRQKGKIGHGSDVVNEQIHVPFVLLGPGAPRGTFDAPTSHVDLVPTLFELLGDATPPARYSDGIAAHRAPADRFVLTTVGWEPRHAVIGRELKVKMYAGSAAAQVTDPDDQPLPDGDAVFAANAARILRALRGEREPVPTSSAGSAGPTGPTTRAHLEP